MKIFGVTENDFGDEFCPEKDATKDFLRKKERLFDPKNKQLSNHIVDYKKELKVQSSDRGKRPYSVYEDKLIIDTIRSCNKLKSMNSSLEEVSGKLMHRTFDSVKERYKKWLKKFSEKDLNKILEFCKDKERVVLDSFMVKRKIHEKKGTCLLTEIVPIEEGMKFNYNKKYIDNDLENIADQESEDSVGVLVRSPRVGICSEMSLDVNNMLAKLNESGKKPSQNLIAYDEPLYDSPRKEQIIISRRPIQFQSAKSNII